jgi:GxxExxY protein
MNDEELNALTGGIINAAFTVLNELGAGFVEEVYHNALVHELTKRGHATKSKQPIEVFYDGIEVGKFFPDLLVNNIVIVELKATKAHDDAFTAQCLNYLKATGKPICLLLNFGNQQLDIRRYRSPQVKS